VGGALRKREGKGERGKGGKGGEWKVGEETPHF